MNQMKYIVIEYSLGEKIYLFTEADTHSEIARDLCGDISKIVSAGFVTYVEDNLECYGRSVSLDIKSRGDIDTALLNRELRGRPVDY